MGEKVCMSQNSNTAMEKELKILEIDSKIIESKLLSLGAKKQFESIFEAYYFDTCQQDLKNEKKVLRVRKEHDGVFVTVKEQQLDSENLKLHKEINLKTDCIDTAIHLVESLGFKLTVHHQKIRSSHKIGNTTFDIDSYTGIHSFIPPLLEIESLDLATINYYIKALELTSPVVVDWNFFELARYYEKKQNN